MDFSFLQSRNLVTKFSGATKAAPSSRYALENRENLDLESFHIVCCSMQGNCQGVLYDLIKLPTYLNEMYLNNII
jgi:hypothetical protein